GIEIHRCVDLRRRVERPEALHRFDRSLLQALVHRQTEIRAVTEVGYVLALDLNGGAIPDALEADTRDSKTGRLVGIAPMQAHEALVLGRRAGSHPSSLRLRTAELSPPPAACYAHRLHPLREIPIRSTAARPTGRPH